MAPDSPPGDDPTPIDATTSGHTGPTPEYVDIQTSVEEDPEEGEVYVNRTAAFAELADRPQSVALDQRQQKNQVHFFDDLLEFDPELAGTIAAQSQAGASGMHVTHPALEGHGHMELSSLEEKITKSCKRMTERLNLREDGATFFRDLAVQGNDVSWVQYEDGNGVTDLEVLPLRALTILDHKTFQNRSDPMATETGESFERTIQSADWYVVNEGTDSEQAYPAHDILHLALNRRRNWHTDLKGRPTFSVWGRGRLKATEYALQAKQNTLANKVAYDDKIIAREVYQINVEDLFGHIRDPEERRSAAKSYAKELRDQIEDLDPDQKPIIPEEVSVDVIGPDGDTARNMSNFIETMNNSIQHALTFHVASFGRDAGGTERGNRPAKEMSDNSVRHLREVLKAGFKRLFKMHAMLVFEEAREVVNPGANDIRRYELKDDITLPTLAFDPVDPTEQQEKVRNAISLYEKGVADLNEARIEADLEPLDQSEIENRHWFRNPTQWSDDDSEDHLYKNQQLPKAGQEPAAESPDSEGPGSEDQTDDTDSDGGESPGSPSGNRRSRPTDSREAYSTDPDDGGDDQ